MRAEEASIDLTMRAPPVSGIPNETADEDLMAAIALSDEAAYRVFINRHIQRMLALSRRLLQDQSAAEDVVQEAFLQIWVRRDQWKSDGSAKPSTWLYRVVVNRCIDVKRRKQNVALEETAEPMDDAEDAVSVIQKREVGERLQKAMAKLTPQQHIAVSLYYFEGCNSADAATIMEINVNAFDSLLKRARQRLREDLRRSSSDVRYAFESDGRI